MSETFYRKYRPLRFEDVVGQESAVKVLTQSLATGKLAHAYLFTGPRGTGKTTLARLFAKAINCSKRKGFEPCGKCAHCVAMADSRSLDVMEIDAASHTGVDNIRELRETVAASPTIGSHKVYIIDEAHMLSLGAWNALLKTLEEPPAHVIFVLATTNVAKVPETILSRTLRLDLRRFPVEVIVKKLEKIAKEEKLKIEKPALTLIARAAQGGMRDAEVLFTQIATLEESPIDADRVALLLGTTTIAANHRILGAIADDDVAQAFTAVRELKDAGANLSHFSASLLEYLRQLLFAAVDQRGADQLITDLTSEEKAELFALAAKLGTARIVECLECFQEAERIVKVSPLPELPLEIALVKLVHGDMAPEKASATPITPNTPASRAPVTPVVPATPPAISKPATSETNQAKETARTDMSAIKTQARETSTKEVATDVPSEADQSLDLGLALRQWQAIVTHALRLNASLGVALSTTSPIIRDNRFLLQVKYPFHKERLEQKTNRLTLDQAFVTILGFQVPWKVVVEGKTESSAAQNTERPAIIDQAINMLGGKLVQEN